MVTQGKEIKSINVGDLIRWNEHDWNCKWFVDGTSYVWFPP